MIKFITAGESHGKGLTAIVSGFPSNLPITPDYINNELRRRQMGYGRGLRMKIETDTADITSGVRFGKTLGSPIAMFIQNRDWENWIEKMSVEEPKTKIEKITIPRPGHADLVGSLKYNFDDIRNSIDRSSARETAARVAACSVARKFLAEFGVEIGSFVESIAGVYPKQDYAEKNLIGRWNKNITGGRLNKLSDKSSVRVLDPVQEEKIIAKIKAAKKKGDTLGGTFFVVATGIPVGLGSFIQYDTKLDADIAHAVVSIHAVKGVEIGLSFKNAELPGSQVHDEILFNGKDFTRRTNRAGGTEGGISTGMPLIVRAAMKPISTLMSPLQSIELSSLKRIESRRERSDFVAVPACAVIAESMVAWVLAKYFLEKFGGDSIEETKDNYRSFTNNLLQRVKKNFK
jgi:chorismate synthase